MHLLVVYHHFFQSFCGQGENQQDHITNQLLLYPQPEILNCRHLGWSLEHHAMFGKFGTPALSFLL
jgi:hypothetical protein